jgi:hypothetical protein
MKASSACTVCTEVASSLISLFPSHVVHPRDGTPQLFDMRGQAVCPACRSIWQHTMRGKTVVLVTSHA